MVVAAVPGGLVCLESSTRRLRILDPDEALLPSNNGPDALELNRRRQSLLTPASDHPGAHHQYSSTACESLQLLPCTSKHFPGLCHVIRMAFLFLQLTCKPAHLLAGTFFGGGKKGGGGGERKRGPHKDRSDVAIKVGPVSILLEALNY